MRRRTTPQRHHVDHLAEAVGAALATRPTTEPRLSWLSSEFPRPVPPQIPAGAPLVGSPSRSTVVGRPVVGTTKLSAHAAGRK